MTARVSRLPSVRASLQHPGVVPADDRFDLRRGKVARSEHCHVLTEWKAGNEGHSSEAIAVLEQEGRSVDLESLTMAGRGRRHARSMRLEIRPGTLGEHQGPIPAILGEARGKNRVE